MKKITNCKIKECGSEVVLLEVDGHPVAVNPGEVEVVLADDQNKFRWATGYLPHANSCVDISARPQRKDRVSLR